MNEKLEIIIGANITDVKKKVQDVKQEIGDFAGDAEKKLGGLKGVMQKVGSSVGDMAKKIGKGLAGAASAVVGVAKATEEYRANQAKLVTAFQTAGASAETAKGVYKDLYRVLGEDDTSVEAANHLAQLTTNEKALSEWTTVCQGAFATFGDSIPIEGLTEAINETVKTGQVTGSLADAINWAKASNEDWSKALSGNKDAQEAFNAAIADGATKEDAFNAALAACNTEAEREALTRQALTGIYGDAAAQYEKNAAAVLAQREAQAKLQAALAKVGEVITPITTALMDLAAHGLELVTPLLEKVADRVLPAMQAAFAKVKESITPVVEALVGFGESVIDKLSGAHEWIEKNSTALQVLAVFMAGLTAAIVAYNAAAIIKKALDIAETVQLGLLIAAETAHSIAAGVAAAATTAFGAAMAFLTSPITLVIAAITAVIAIIVLCVKHWDTIKAKVIEVWNAITAKVQAAVESVKTKFQEMKDKISEVVEAVKTFISEKFEAIKTTITTIIQAVKTLIATVFSAIKTDIQTKLQAIKSLVDTIFDGIKNSIQTRIETAKNVVKNVIALIKSIFSGDLNGAKTAALNIFDAIKNGIKTRIENAKNTVKSAIDKIKSFMNFSWSLPKLKLPHISISGKFKLDPPSVPKFSISWYAQGGVFDSPTLFPWYGGVGGLGEQGAEAIVPLEKNTEWLTKIADMLTERMGGGSMNITLEVDGKTFGEVAVDSINSLTKMRGSLPLRIM